MFTELDHVIIAVRDLRQAMAQLSEAMGLVVAAGGEHPGLGTRNGITRFGLDYVELIAIDDQALALTHPHGRALAQFLAREEGLLGFAVGSDALSADVATLRSRGVPMTEPMPGVRRRSDCTSMTWKAANVDSDLWGQRLPFLIQHDTDAGARRAWAPAGGHPLGATGISGLAFAVSNREAAQRRFEQFLGQLPEAVEEVPALPARRATFRLGPLRLELLEPAASSGGLHDFVRERGDGLFLVSLAVTDVDRAVQELRERGTAVGNPTARRRAPLLDPSQTLGVRFQLIEQAQRT